MNNEIKVYTKSNHLTAAVCRAFNGLAVISDDTAALNYYGGYSRKESNRDFVIKVLEYLKARDIIQSYRVNHQAHEVEFTSTGCFIEFFSNEVWFYAQNH